MRAWWLSGGLALVLAGVGCTGSDSGPGGNGMGGATGNGSEGSEGSEDGQGGGPGDLNGGDSPGGGGDAVGGSAGDAGSGDGTNGGGGGTDGSGGGESNGSGSDSNGGANGGSGDNGGGDPDPNEPPEAVDDSATVDEDDLVDIDVLANDSDADDTDTLVLQSVGEPGHGTATVRGGEVRYEPSADFNGEDSFSYTVSDGSGGTDTGTVTVTVAAVNDRPTLTLGDDITIDEDASAQTRAGFASASPGPADEASQVVSFDVENDGPSLFATQPSIDATGQLSFEPAADAAGVATVTATAVDEALSAMRFHE